MDSTIPSKKRKLSENAAPLIQEIKPEDEPPVKKKKVRSGKDGSEIETPTTDFGELSLGMFNFVSCFARVSFIIFYNLFTYIFLQKHQLKRRKRKTKRKRKSHPKKMKATI